MNKPVGFDRSTTPHRRFNYNIQASVVLLLQCHCRSRNRGKVQNVSPSSVLLESSRNFYNTQETQTQKMDQNFEIRILWFLKFSKRHHAVPLRPMRAIMVAAILDQSRVLVTKFHQNRLTLKGRSAGQRHIHTHWQTNWAENNGPSGLKSGQKVIQLTCYSGQPVAGLVSLLMMLSSHRVT